MELPPDPQREALQAMPSIAAIAAWLAGLTLDKWLAIAGLVFIIVQTLGYLWRLRRDMRREAERVARNEPPPESGSGDL
jgi:hypothetical protein